MAAESETFQQDAEVLLGLGLSSGAVIAEPQCIAEPSVTSAAVTKIKQHEGKIWKIVIKSNVFTY